ncbi:hypothetical protein CL647_07715 [bacterium]|nr:hypothetical protein [bacterium]|tara:strand:+ start:410 stop:601 length:192 start_codon:yes stop_codon:yes gene_type:complete
MKGLILVESLGTCLHLLTRAITKQLPLVYDRLQQELDWQATSFFKSDLETTISYYLNHYVTTS